MELSLTLIRNEFVELSLTSLICSMKVTRSSFVVSGGVFSSIYFNGASQSSAVLNAIPKQASSVSYGLPQVLQGLWLLHQTFGRKPWAELLSSAAILAREGFLVDANLHAALLAHQDKVRSSEGLRHLFCGPHQELKEVGERVEEPTLGKLLEQIASSMVEPTLSDQIILSLMKDIGVTDKKKFTESRRLTIEDPLTLHMDTITLLTSGGPTAGTILSNSILKVYNGKLNGSSESVSQLLLDSFKQTYAVAGAWTPQSFGGARPPQSSSGGARPPQSSSSGSLVQNLAPVGSNVLIADTSGDIFILSLTLNTTFGSGFVSPSTGILLSDFVQGQDSSLLYWACPSVLVYGADHDVMGLAAYGRSSVLFSMAQVIISHLLLENDLTESVTASLVEIPPTTSDPWYEYFGLQGNGTRPVVAVEVQAEHVHVKKSDGLCCYPAGL